MITALIRPLFPNSQTNFYSPFKRLNHQCPCFSCLYVIVHWPSDIIAGAIVGLISARIMSTVNSLLQPISQFCLRLFHFGPYA
jgi:hypothetical protein